MNLQKGRFGDSGPAASPMIKLAIWRGRRRRLRQLKLHRRNCIPFPRGKSSSFILEFVFDFRKDNLVHLVMRSLFPYQRRILLDFWKDDLVILVIRSIFPYQGLLFPYQGLSF